MNEEELMTETEKDFRALREAIDEMKAAILDAFEPLISKLPEINRQLSALAVRLGDIDEWEEESE